MGGRFCPPDSHSTIAYGIAQPPEGPSAGPGGRAARTPLPHARALAAACWRPAPRAGCGLLGLDPADLRLQLGAPRAAGRERARWRLRARCSAACLDVQELVHPGQRSTRRAVVARDRPVGRLELRPAGGGGVGLGLRGAGDRDDRLLLLLGAAQEVEPVEQIGEAVRLEDDRDQIGLATLVVRRPAGGEIIRARARRALSTRAGAARGSARPGPRASLARSRAELRADGGLAALDQRDLRVQRADQPREAGDARRQAPLAGLTAPSCEFSWPRLGSAPARTRQCRQAQSVPRRQPPRRRSSEWIGAPREAHDVAYGVSCRARAAAALRRHQTAIRPKELGSPAFPR